MKPSRPRSAPSAPGPLAGRFLAAQRVPTEAVQPSPAPRLPPTAWPSSVPRGLREFRPLTPRESRPALVAGRVAAVLRAALESSGGWQGAISLALAHLAPSCRVRPCGSVCCCWRWAAQELLGEYSSVYDVASKLRIVLEEEFHESFLQQLLDLREEYAVVAARLEHALDESERVAKCCETLTLERDAAAEAKADLACALRRADEARETMESELRAEIEAVNQRLSDALSTSDAKRIHYLEQKNRESEVRADGLQIEADEAKAAYKTLYERVHEMEFKLKVHEAHDASLHKKRRGKLKKSGA